MKLLNRIHAWVRKHTTVCGMTLDEIDEYKEQCKQERNYRELLKERDELAKLCYAFMTIKGVYLEEAKFYIRAYDNANSFMKIKYSQEWLDALTREKGEGKND